MKGALACYVEAVRALRDAGVRLRGDVLIAAVCGEIEKTQQGDAVGAEYRGYAAGSRATSSPTAASPTCACSASRPRARSCSATTGRSWLRIRVHGDFIHTAFSEGRRDRNAILRQHQVLAAVQEWIPTWEDDPSNGYRGAKAIVNVGAVEGGFGWRVSRTPHHADLFLDVRVPPTKPMAVARREVLDMVRGLAERFPDYGVEGEVYVTAPGAEIDEGHELVAAIDARARGGVRRGARPRRDAVVLRCVRAHALRHPDGELRDVDGPDGRRAGREPRDRRPRAHRGGVREGRHARLRRGVRPQVTSCN